MTDLLVTSISYNLALLQGPFVFQIFYHYDFSTFSDRLRSDANEITQLVCVAVTETICKSSLHGPESTENPYDDHYKKPLSTETPYDDHVKKPLGHDEINVHL